MDELLVSCHEAQRGSSLTLVPILLHNDTDPLTARSNRGFRKELLECALTEPQRPQSGSR